MDATVDLEDRYVLNELRLYMFQNSIGSIGQNWKIEAYLNGEWSTVKTIVTNAELEALIVDLDGGSIEDRFVSIDLGGVVAEKLRFSATAVSGDSVSIVEMRCLGVPDEINAEYDNILEGKSFSGETATDVSGQYRFGYDKLTDGVLSTDWKYGRFSSSEGFLGTVDLQKVYRLNKLRIYSYQLEKNTLTPAGQNWKIEVYLNEEWKTVKTIAASEELASLVVTEPGGTLEDKWISIDLGGVLAERIRLTAEKTSAGYISINEIRCSAVPAKYYAEYSDNVLEGYEFIGSKPVTNADYGYNRLTDGIISETYHVGRYSSPTDGSFEAFLDFGGVYLLNKMRFYIFNKQYADTGKNWTVEVYADGAWKTVKTIATHEAFIALEETNGGSGPEDEWIEVDLGCVAAEKIRLSANALEGRIITFTEIRCSGYEMIGISVDRSAMIEAYENVAALRVSGDEHRTKLALFREYLTDLKLTEENATLYSEAMDTYYNGYSHCVLTLSDAGVTTDLGNPIKGYTLPVGNAWVSPTGTVYAGGAAIPDLTEDTTYYALKSTLLDGAAIRTNSPTGLRFTMTVDENLIGVLKTNSVAFTVGILIYPTDQLGVGTLTRETDGVIDLCSHLSGVNPIDGVYTMFGSITNIRQQNFARAFSARAYIKVGETVIYTDYTAVNNSRSVYEVAKEAYEDRPAGVSPYSDAQLSVIRSFIDAVVEITSISVGSVTQYSATYYVPTRTVTYNGTSITMNEGESVKSIILGSKVYIGGWTVTDGTLAAPYVTP